MARVHAVQLDVGIADADMELDREAPLPRDVGAGPDQVPLQHRSVRRTVPVRSTSASQRPAAASTSACAGFA